MTGPALLIPLLAKTLELYSTQGTINFTSLALKYSLWLITVLILYFTTHILRGKANFTTTLRITGFALSAHIFELFFLIPGFSEFGHTLSIILAILIIWYGISIVNKLKGWRTILLPIIYFAVYIVSYTFINSIIVGTSFTIQALINDTLDLFK